jgi:ABC-type nitrate/sulfonate/bicarbonate transport system substrate-binding protein
MMFLSVVNFYAASPGLAETPLQPLTIQLDWVANAAFSGILVAKDRGWYRESGIDLTILEKASSVDIVLSGKAQIGVAEGAVIIESRSKGQEIRAIAAHYQKSPYCLIAKESSGITAPEQLAGKKIGVPKYVDTLMLSIVLATQGLTLEDIVLVRTAGNIQPFINDEIDVCQGYMNNEYISLRQQGYKIAYIPAFKYGYDFYSSVCFATDTMIQKQPELIRKFLKVSLRGWEEAFRNQESTAQLVVEKFYPQGSVPHETESLKFLKFVAKIGEGKKYLGWMEESFWAKGIDILYEFKQIEKKIPAKDVFTPQFLRDIYFE